MIPGLEAVTPTERSWGGLCFFPLGSLLFSCFPSLRLRCSILQAQLLQAAPSASGSARPGGLCMLIAPKPVHTWAGESATKMCLSLQLLWLLVFVLLVQVVGNSV